MANAGILAFRMVLFLCTVGSYTFQVYYRQMPIAYVGPDEYQQR